MAARTKVYVYSDYKRKTGTYDTIQAESDGIFGNLKIDLFQWVH